MTVDPPQDRSSAVVAPPHAADPAPHRHEALGVFARRMAHDLNNFATVIRTYSELLLGELPPTTATHADVSEIHRAADAMVSYVQRIARFARASGMRTCPVDLDVVIADVLASVAAGTATPTATSAVYFDRSTGAPITGIETDAAWLADVLRELVANAREASPTDGTVSISRISRTIGVPEPHGTTEVPVGRWAQLSVADNGPGFAPSVHETAEDPFVTTKDGVRGAGFGLTLALAFAHAQHGRLSREREAGRTVVSLWFPLRDAAA